MSLRPQKPSSSRQDYGTPRDFLDAVVSRFGPLTIDLAATAENAKAPNFFQHDSLVEDWTEHRGNAWLNPPFARIDPWAAKCADALSKVLASTERRHRYDWRILMLTPASVGSVWYLEHVHARALVMPLSPRLVFVGEMHPYPKDLMLTVWGERPGFVPWRWR